MIGAMLRAHAARVVAVVGAMLRAYARPSVLNAAWVLVVVLVVVVAIAAWRNEDARTGIRPWLLAWSANEGV